MRTISTRRRVQVDPTFAEQAYYLPSIPLLVLSSFVDEPLDRYLGKFISCHSLQLVTPAVAAKLRH